MSFESFDGESTVDLRREDRGGLLKGNGERTSPRRKEPKTQKEK